MPARPTLVPSQPSSGPPSDRQISLYISEMCAELRQLAKQPRFRTVNYLLDMARLESERLSKELPD